MASVVISGDTSGTVTLSVPAVAGSTTISLPATSGTVAFPPYGTSQISDGAITAAKLDGAQTGSAPAYVARAWVSFDGTTTTPTVRSSGNVSSLTDNGVGDYTINMTTSLSNANYSYCAGTIMNNSTALHAIIGGHTTVAPTSSALRILVRQHSAGSDQTALDLSIINIAIFG